MTCPACGYTEFQRIGVAVPVEGGGVADVWRCRRGSCRRWLIRLQAGVAKKV